MGRPNDMKGELADFPTYHIPYTIFNFSLAQFLFIISYSKPPPALTSYPHLPYFFPKLALLIYASSGNTLFSSSTPP